MPGSYRNSIVYLHLHRVIRSPVMGLSQFCHTGARKNTYTRTSLTWQESAWRAAVACSGVAS
jgi:hypothetical protein